MPQLSLFDLTGRRALITGSSRGLGLELARGLSAAGAALIINGRDTHRLGAAAETLAAEGATVKALAFDTTSPDSVTDAISYAEAEIGPIDILINNAGILKRGRIEETSAEDFEHLLEANVMSVLHVSKAVAPHMIGRGRGKIINIGSIAAQRPRAGNAPYSLSKAAVEHLTCGMAADWAPLGLNVNCISPGFMAAGMNTETIKNPETVKWVESRVPMGRWGREDELTGAAIFLASEASCYVNGQVLRVDGGAGVTA